MRSIKGNVPGKDLMRSGGDLSAFWVGYVIYHPQGVLGEGRMPEYLQNVF